MVFAALAGCITSPSFELGSGEHASETHGITHSEADEAAKTNTQLKDTSAVSAEPSQADQPEHGDLWARLRYGFELRDAYSHPDVHKALSRYESRQAYFDTVIERARPFLFDIVEQVEARELPLELALVPFVESAFNPNAYSSQHAVGLWQFMPLTGRSFGLTQDWWVDQRRDPVDSTRAALDYLEALYAEFDNDWLLAFAAYNTGGGNVRRAMKKSSNEDTGQSAFWGLQLTGETRTHIPRILALARVIAAPNDYKVTLTSLPNSSPTTRITLDSQIDLSRAANLAGIPTEDLRALNPQFRQWATPPDGSHLLALPRTAAAAFIERLARQDAGSLVTFDRYAIRQGDTLGAIARRLGTRVDVLQRVNSLPNSRIVAGRSLLIPRGHVSLDSSTLPTQNDRSFAKAPEVYTVRRGDNLWSIARRYNLRSAEIRSLNNLANDPLLKPGQKLTLLADTPRVSTATD